MDLGAPKIFKREALDINGLTLLRLLRISPTASTQITTSRPKRTLLMDASVMGEMD
jgi:hypothetical protein